MTAVPAKKASPAKRRSPGRPRKQTEPPQPALIEEPQQVPDDRPTHHNGVPILREELVSNLPRAPFRISRLYLEGGGMAYACRDCVFTGSTRGLVMQHRNEEHGANFGARFKHRDIPPQRSTPDIVLPHFEGRSSSADPLDWTLKELLAVCPSITALGDMVEEAQRRADAAVEELHELKIATRDWKAKADAYDNLRDELNALRNWKRKTVTRLSQVGFRFDDDEE